MRTLLAAVLLLLAAACKGNVPSPDPAYVAEIEAWRDERLERLTADDGWLTVVGLHWLAPGVNRFGSDPANEIPLNAPDIPAARRHRRVARRRLGGRARGRRCGGHDQRRAARGVGHSAATPRATRTSFGSDASASSSSIAAGGSAPASRTPRPRRARGSRASSTSRSTRATASRPGWNRTRSRGRCRSRPCSAPRPRCWPQGSCASPCAARSSAWSPTSDTSDEPHYFLIFRDRTSGDTTYGGGRFLDAATVGVDGATVLDFNLAYSPPCAFTPHATCPLPPPQNSLTVAVEAGEMFLGQAH